MADTSDGVDGPTSTPPVASSPPITETNQEIAVEDLIQQFTAETPSPTNATGEEAQPQDVEAESKAERDSPSPPLVIARCSSSPALPSPRASQTASSLEAMQRGHRKPRPARSLPVGPISAASLGLDTTESKSALDAVLPSTKISVDTSVGADRDSPFNTSDAGSWSSRFSSRRGPKQQPARALTTTEVNVTQRQMNSAAVNSVRAKFRLKRFDMKRALYLLASDRRARFYKELLRYICFLALLFFVLWSQPIHYPFEQNSILRTAFIDQELPTFDVRKTFNEVGSIEELWIWARGPLLDGIYGERLPDLSVIGAVEIRQIRVRPGSCKRAGEILGDDICYPTWKSSRESQEPYGSRDQYSYERLDSNLWRSLVFSPHLLDTTETYGRGGFVALLPKNDRAAAEAVLDELEEDYIDLSTRAVAFSFTMYHPHLDSFSVGRLLFEISTTRFIEPTHRIRTFQLLLYDDVIDVLRGEGTSIFLLAVVFYFFVNEFREARDLGFKPYFSSFWNLLELTQLSIVTSYLVMRWIYASRSRNAWDEALFCATTGCFVDFNGLAWYSQALYNVAATNSLFSFFKVFKFLRLNERMNIMWHTLKTAVWDLVAFMAIFALVFLGYTIMGFLAFGPYIREFHNLSSSFWACFTMLLGSFNYDRLNRASPYFAPFFFATYMLLVYITLINMFIAIMNENFVQVQQNQRNARSSKQVPTVARVDSSPGSSGDMPLPQNPSEHSSSTSSATFADERLDDGLDIEYDVLTRLRRYISHLPPRFFPWYGDPRLKGQSKREPLALHRGRIVLLVDRDWHNAFRHRLRAKFKALVFAVIFCLEWGDVPEYVYQAEEKRRRLAAAATTAAATAATAAAAAATTTTTTTTTATAASSTTEPSSSSPTHAPSNDGGSPILSSTSVAGAGAGAPAGGGSPGKASPKARAFRRRRAGSISRILRHSSTAAAGSPVARRLPVIVPVHSRSMKAWRLLRRIQDWTSLSISSKDAIYSDNLELRVIPPEIRHDVLWEMEMQQRAADEALFGPTVASGSNNATSSTANASGTHADTAAPSSSRPGSHRSLRGSAPIAPSPLARSARGSVTQPAPLRERTGSGIGLVRPRRRAARLSVQMKDDSDRILDLSAKKRENSTWRLCCCRKRSTNMFGLLGVSAHSANPDHPLLCVVERPATLEGGEVLQVPWWVWLVVACWSVAGGIWAFFRSLFTFKFACNWRKSKTPSLLTDRQLQRLFSASLGPNKQGGSCRFDELVREVRIFLARTSEHRSSEEEVVGFVVAVLNRFESAVYPVSSKDLVAHTYVPKPIDTSKIKLPVDLVALGDVVAENCHEVWARSRVKEGWRYASSRDNQRKKHPDLLPYGMLDESSKQYDRESSRETLKCILALGYEIKHTSESLIQDHQFGRPSSTDSETYEPRPFPTEDVIVPPDIVQLGEMLAENSHDLWARSRIRDGWRFGSERDDEQKVHPLLIPYYYLTHSEKDLDREGSMQTLKLVLGLGYTIRPAVLGSSRTSRVGRKSTYRSFGTDPSQRITSISGAASVMKMGMKLKDLATRVRLESVQEDPALQEPEVDDGW